MSRDRPPPEVPAALRSEVDSVERVALRRFDPGMGAVVIAAAMMVLLLAALLPWIGSASGFEVLRGADVVDPLQRLFAGVALGFGAVLSGLALLTRRWALAWACALGCAYSVLDGMWAFWSSRTAEGPGPGIGLILAEVAMLVLAATWLRIATSRS